MTTPEEFEERIYEAGVIEAGSHSVFSQGLHGQKADLSVIDPGSALWDEWVQLNVDKVIELDADTPPDFLIGVDRGTTELVDAVADELDGVTALHTVKGRGNLAYLRQDAIEAIRDRADMRRAGVGITRYVRVRFLEDVSTTGSGVSRPIDEINGLGLPVAMRVITTLQRRERLEYLDDRHIAYHAIVKQLTPTYTKEECEDHGFCADGMPLRPYPASTS
jgi:pyrimidine operon attenuation protein/uracil phosphoribosyltransferase